MRHIIIITALALAACSTQPRQETADTPAPARVAAPALHDTDIAAPGHAPAAGAAVAAPDGPAADLWQHIRAELHLQRHVDQRTVQDKMAWYRRNQDYLDRVATRARPYLHHVVTEIEKRGMPLDLALLPIVESAYHPFAYSRSRASGIWQFIPGTGRRFGLKQNWWYDGRRDIVAATRAALDYLELLHAEFDGDWLLALAAYNSGERNVARAVARNRKAGKPIDFWSLAVHLPRETRGYVPSLLAVAELLANSEQHGVQWQAIDNQPHFARVDIDGQIDLATAAELAGLGMDDFYNLNPGFNQWATDPDGPHYLLVPVAKADEFRHALRNLPADQRLKWTRHTIAQGETLGGIAERYGVGVAALQQANGLRGHLIRSGDALLIPGPGASAAHYTQSADNRMRRGLPGATVGDFYTVRRGDTLWEISRRHGVSMEQISGWNGLNPGAVLRPGQRLRLAAATPQAHAVALRGETHGTRPSSYTVQKGDSLWLISRRFGVSVAQLQQWNSLERGSVLRPGQNLIIALPSGDTGV